MGIELIYAVDPHNSDEPPRSRSDNYSVSILTKLAEIVELCNKRQVQGLVFSGDMFHKKRPKDTSHELIQNLITIFKLCKCPVWTIVGNHDTEGGDLQELSKQPLGTLLTSGALHLLDCEQYSFGSRRVHLVGHHYNRREDAFVGEIERDERHSSITYIDVVHSPVVVDPVNYPAIYVSDLWNRGIWNVLLAGHIHNDLGIWKDPSSGRQFANPGAISRGSIEEANILRSLRVLSVKCDYESPVLEPINLRSYKPANEVFKVEEYKKAKEQSQAFKNFASFVSTKMQVVAGHGVNETLDRFFVDNNIDSETQVAVRGYLEKARVG